MATPNNEMPGGSRPNRVLVVDDDPDVGEFIFTAAEAMNFQCITTSRAQDFMAAFHPGFTLVILDLVMPGMDGVELLRWLGQQECRAGVLLMSGMDKRVLESAESLAQLLGLTVVGALRKPFRLAELESVLMGFAGDTAVPPPRGRVSIAVSKSDLQRAIDQRQFVLHYQPQIDIASGDVVGLEALVRWRHPEFGLIYPDSFIALAESCGLIDQLGWLVVDRGLAEAQSFISQEGRLMTLSLNVSAHSLTDLQFPDKLISLTTRHGVAPERVILEVTESGLFDNLSSALDVLTRLRIRRVQLSIDDFGTGYAMMQQLRNVPATEIKIDKSFVADMHQNDAAHVVVQKTIEIGHELGLKVLAEGVETAEQLKFLRANGCDLAQGYFYSRPLPMPDLLNWFRYF
jgi:EAL domain-containing protein (putative c-di-GMP-specific phosphodiesterase class I)